jgi:hypothetical protein
LTEDQREVAKAIGAANSEFRRMVAYRKQDVHARGVAARSEHRAKRTSDGTLQHPKFQRQLQDLGKSLYIGGAEEVERWTQDRERMFETKYETIDITETEATWRRAIQRMRGTVASKLETEFARERLRLQAEFARKFRLGILRLFPKPSAEALRLVHEIVEALGKGDPFGPKQVLALVKTIEADSYFLDDVASVVYSLAVSLEVPDVYWVHEVRAKTHFLSIQKSLVVPDDDPHQARWVLRVRPSDLGANAFLFATTLPACRSLTSQERLDFVRSFPKAKLVQAALSIHDDRLHTVCDELRQALADLSQSGRVRCTITDAPALQQRAVKPKGTAHAAPSSAANEANSPIVLTSSEHTRFAQTVTALNALPPCLIAPRQQSAQYDKAAPSTADQPMTNTARNAAAATSTSAAVEGATHPAAASCVSSTVVPASGGVVPRSHHIPSPPAARRKQRPSPQQSTSPRR